MFEPGAFVAGATPGLAGSVAVMVATIDVARRAGFGAVATEAIDGAVRSMTRVVVEVGPQLPAASLPWT